MQPDQQPTQPPQEPAPQTPQAPAPTPAYTPQATTFGASPVASSQPGMGVPAQSNKTNGLAIAGLVLAFIIPLIGLILSIVGLNQINKKGEKGKGLAIAGIVLSALFMIASVLMLMTILAAAPKLQEHARDVSTQNDINILYASLEAFYNENNYYPASLQELPKNEGFEPSSLSYDYKTEPSGCTKCKSYTLSAALEDGTPYTKKSLY